MSLVTFIGKEYDHTNRNIAFQNWLSAGDSSTNYFNYNDKQNISSEHAPAYNGPVCKVSTKNIFWARSLLYLYKEYSLIFFEKI